MCGIWISSESWRLPDYPLALAQRAFQQEFQIGINQPAQGSFQDLGLKGFRLQSRDNLQITQFNRDGFAFSRLQPYESWQGFSRKHFDTTQSLKIVPTATP